MFDINHLSPHVGRARIRVRIVIIGGSGHVGTYLVPRLVAAEHKVNVSRAQREPYKAHSAWRLVQQVTADRTAEDAAGVFGQRIRELQPDVVIDTVGSQVRTCIAHQYKLLICNNVLPS